MSDDASPVPLRLEGSPDVIAFALAHASEHDVERSEPIVPEEPLASPQSAIAGAIMQNLQLIDMVFKTSGDAIGFLTALAAFVKLPSFHGSATVQNPGSRETADAAVAGAPDRAPAFVAGAQS